MSYKAVIVSIGLAMAAGAAQAQGNGLSISKGVYNCELNRKVQITELSADNTVAKIKWGTAIHTLTAVPARTGALRFEDAASGLTWLVVVGKSMLLDTKKGQQLANECNT